MKIQSKFMTGLVSRIVKKVLRTKLGCEVDIQLNEFRTTVIDDKTHVHLDLDADLTKEELNKLLKTTSAGVTRKAITWFLVRTAMFHHLRIKIWYAAAPIPGTTTYQKFLWIAIPNGRSYQKVINWPRGAEKWVRASARKRHLAAACGKPNALLAPPEGG